MKGKSLDYSQNTWHCSRILWRHRCRGYSLVGNGTLTSFCSEARRVPRGRSTWGPWWGPHRRRCGCRWGGTGARWASSGSRSWGRSSAAPRTRPGSLQQKLSLGKTNLFKYSQIFTLFNNGINGHGFRVFRSSFNKEKLYGHTHTGVDIKTQGKETTLK